MKKSYKNLCNNYDTISRPPDSEFSTIERIKECETTSAAFNRAQTLYDTERYSSISNIEEAKDHKQSSQRSNKI